MSEHTPGPWQLRERLLASDPFEIIGDIDGDANDDGTPRMIYTEVTEVYDNEDAEANSRLIVAAPDLYEALCNVRKLISEGALTGFNPKDGDWADRLFESQQMTSKAIAKVKS